ncbi:PAS domain-containing protein [Halomonas sp. SL1]|uniref:PAS domain-containing protein n=1 Tax=Halomonas sp. SL1 TaxID=2137478 RepID=UPI0021AC59EC|nr:PAS domain-containing protein [Halomonas sp. SL1]
MSRPRLRLNTWISLLVAVMVVLSLGLALWLFTAQLRATLEEDQATRVTDLAQTLAADPEVQAALQGRIEAPVDDGALQARIDGLRRALGVDFIVVMDAGAIRLTHPDPERIGRHFQGGDEGRALAGETYHSRAEGTLGTSIRGFAPVTAGDGEVVGAVSVGVTLSSLAPLLADNRRDVMLGVLALMIVGGLGARGLAQAIKRVLLGLEPHQIARLVEERQAMLASVHEGILAVDRQARVTLVNPAARRMLAEAGLGEPAVGTAVADCLPHSGLPELLSGGEGGEGGARARSRDRSQPRRPGGARQPAADPPSRADDRCHSHLPRQERGQRPGRAAHRGQPLRRGAARRHSRVQEPAPRYVGLGADGRSR